MVSDPKRIQEVFLEAVELPSSDWGAVLERKCGGDAELRQRVEALLRAHGEPGSFLERPGLQESPTIDDQITERPGTVIGPYRLMEQIGEGGMGLVFVAEQQQPIRRRVALKVIKPGMDSRQVIARFEAERQALALMDHPNIAKVYDGGTTGGERGRVSAPSTPGAEATRLAGRPYFVMELVKGVPIADYCDQNQVPIRERLELFVHVCQAVQHAHQKGIIHRDIKPSNVMVASHDGTPVVKVIDFGVAKAIGQHLTDKTVYTQFTQLVGSPLYMSPEQAGQSGLDIDTRTDIYSLGVLLYELLTGTTPFARERLREASYEEMRRIIREEEPPKPSTRISTLGQAATTISTQRKSDPRRLSQICRGELDWIVMKALEKDRNRRYETASAFAADVQHYLRDEPVTACQPSAWYRFRKFGRRNRVAVAMAAVVTGALVLLLAGLAVGIILLRRANTLLEVQVDETRRQSHLAEDNFRKARQAVDDYLTKVSENRLLKSPAPGLQPLRKELLETALKYYQAFVEEHPEEPAVRSELARAYFRVGSIQEEIAMKAEASQAYQSSRLLWERLVHDDPANSVFQQQLAECLRKIGRLQSTFLGHPGEGLQALQHAVALYEQLTLAEPKNVELQSGLARTFDELARWSAYRGQRSEELKFHRRALEIWQWLAEADSRFRSQLGTSTTDIGYYFTRTGKASEALELLEKARKIFVKLCDENPRDTALLGELRRVYTNIGYVHYALTAQFPEALRAYDQARQVLEQLTRDHPAVTEFQARTAGIYKQIGEVLSATCHFDQAEDRYRQALAILDKIVEADPGNTQEQYHRADIYVELGQAQLRLDHLQEALASSQKSQAILDELLRRDPDQIEYAIERSRSYELAGCVYRKTGRWDDAMRSYRRAIDLLSEKVPENSQRQDQRVLCNFVSFYTGLGDVQRAAGQRVEAERMYRQVQDMRENYFGDEVRQRGNRGCFYPGWIALAQVEIDRGKRQDARRRLHELRTFIEKLPERNNEDLYNLACVRTELSRLAGSGQATLTAAEQTERLQYIDQAMDALRKAIASGYRDVAELKTSTSLDPLRDRDDFRKLVAGLEATKEKGRK
jgi:serine/threonine protein kinase/tetratricopeptide (TPR) repeat protein